MGDCIPLRIDGKLDPGLEKKVIYWGNFFGFRSRDDPTYLQQMKMFGQQGYVKIPYKDQMLSFYPALDFMSLERNLEDAKNGKFPWPNMIVVNEHMFHIQGIMELYDEINDVELAQGFLDELRLDEPQRYFDEQFDNVQALCLTLNDLVYGMDCIAVITTDMLGTLCQDEKISKRDHDNYENLLEYQTRRYGPIYIMRNGDPQTGIYETSIPRSLEGVHKILAEWPEINSRMKNAYKA